MPRWLRWAKRGSRQRRTVQPRVLRIDVLESRQLLSSTHFDWSPERPFLDEGEFEDRYEADERVAKPPAAYSGYVARWDDDWGEDEEWEEEAWEEEAWEHESEQVMEADLSVPRTTELDDSDDTEIVVSLPTSEVIVLDREDAVAVLPVRTTSADLVESDLGGVKTDLQENDESLDSRNRDEPGTNRSPSPTGLVDLDARTANLRENQADGNGAEYGRATPERIAGFIHRSEERIPSGDADKELPGVGRTKATDADDALETPALTLDSSRRESAPGKETQPDRALRRTEIPFGSRERGPDRMFAALASASPDTSIGRLRDAVSQDLAALETALQDFLADGTELGRHLTDWFLRPDVFRWTVAATIASIAAEIVRRKAQRARSDAVGPACDSLEVSVRLFPELGLPPRVRP